MALFDDNDKKIETTLYLISTQLIFTVRGFYAPVALMLLWKKLCIDCLI